MVLIASYHSAILFKAIGSSNYGLPNQTTLGQTRTCATVPLKVHVYLTQVMSCLCDGQLN
jgi:hypothetical protein